VTPLHPFRRSRLAAVATGAVLLEAMTGTGLHAARPAVVHSATEPAVQVAFARDSYVPGAVARLRFFAAAHGIVAQVFESGPETVATRRPDVMNGVAVTPRRWLGSRIAGSSARIAVGDWPSGLYFAKLTSKEGLVGYAPFVVRPRKLGEHRIAVVLPTQTWQAYNFRDDNRDGTPDTWYARHGPDTVRLHRPFLDRGVPYRFRHYDLPFLHWLARTGKQVDLLTDSDLELVRNPAQLAAAYDLIVFSGHHEYITTHEYDLVEGYRNRGGNLMFLFANDFFWRVVRRGDTITRVAQWRTLGRPEAALIGVEYRGNDRGQRKGPWIVRTTSTAPWLFSGTELASGSRFGSGGIEIDARAPSSPRQLLVLAKIPRLYGPGFTAQMTYYATPAGAKVFAAGAFNLVESIMEPDRALPDATAQRNEAGARQLLENLWAQLATP
jgi:N,N-dimethylformamidase beta subunit-like protein